VYYIEPPTITIETKSYNGAKDKILLFSDIKQDFIICTDRERQIQRMYMQEIE
jgi:hypothetical protein